MSFALVGNKFLRNRLKRRFTQKQILSSVTRHGPK